MWSLEPGQQELKIQTILIKMAKMPLPLFSDCSNRAAPIGSNLQSESSHATPVHLLIYHELQESRDSQSQKRRPSLIIGSRQMSSWKVPHLKKNEHKKFTFLAANMSHVMTAVHSLWRKNIFTNGQQDCLATIYRSPLYFITQNLLARREPATHFISSCWP